MMRGRNAIEEALAARMYEGEDIQSATRHGANLERLPALIAFRLEQYRRKLRIPRRADALNCRFEKLLPHQLPLTSAPEFEDASPRRPRTMVRLLTHIALRWIGWSEGSSGDRLAEMLRDVVGRLCSRLPARPERIWLGAVAPGFHPGTLSSGAYHPALLCSWANVWKKPVTP
jgi:hypothetical protein